MLNFDDPVKSGEQLMNSPPNRIINNMGCFLFTSVYHQTVNIMMYLC